LIALKKFMGIFKDVTESYKSPLGGWFTSHTIQISVKLENVTALGCVCYQLSINVFDIFEKISQSIYIN
jgi:hypothetical protein